MGTITRATDIPVRPEILVAKIVVSRSGYRA
jgi:hypothetical protein